MVSRPTSNSFLILRRAEVGYSSAPRLFICFVLMLRRAGLRLRLYSKCYLFCGNRVCLKMFSFAIDAPWRAFIVVVDTDESEKWSHFRASMSSCKWLRPATYSILESSFYVHIRLQRRLVILVLICHLLRFDYTLAPHSSSHRHPIGIIHPPGLHLFRHRLDQASEKETLYLPAARLTVGLRIRFWSSRV